MMHKTNTLRLLYLVNELRDHLYELREKQKHHAKNPNSKYAIFYDSVVRQFEGELRRWSAEMDKIKWVEPNDSEEPQDPTP